MIINNTTQNMFHESLEEKKHTTPNYIINE